jgi:glycosyltransferase involved in cell wall biosynthesis
LIIPQESSVKLAFVIPWFGLDIPGGAEAESLNTACHLHDAGVPVEVLTTCIKEFRSDWSTNYHPRGTDIIRGMTVRRFPVGQRDVHAFNQINARLMNRLPITAAEEAVFIREMIRCDELVEWIEQHQDEYFYAFIPYMFTTTVNGVRAAPGRAVLIPCLHDESYAYLGIYKPIFEQARGVVLHTPAEEALARRLYNLRNGAGRLVGEGVDTRCAADPARFKRKYRLDRFLLYAGRKDAGKNVPLLVDYFCRYKDLFPGALKLVFIGDGSVSIPAGHEQDVIDLGFVPVQDKSDAYAAAVALCQPSLNESFSLVVMESWLAERPVLVHERCQVTRDHCLASSGGLFFDSFSDFVGCLDYLQENERAARRMAHNGRRYVQANYAWDRIVKKYLHALHGWGFDL